jgi:hypothetical protein
LVDEGLFDEFEVARPEMTVVDGCVGIDVGDDFFETGNSDPNSSLQFQSGYWVILLLLELCFDETETVGGESS